MNKQELQARIITSRDQLEAALNRISDERKSLVILHGDWSIKDLIGHLGFWENEIVTLFNMLIAGKTPEPFTDIDVLNAQSIAEFRTQSLAKVQAFEKKAYQDILSLIGKASDQELFDADHFVWCEGRCFEEFISDNTWGHYDEHLPELIAWLKRIA
jgi:hypothetical protein